MEMYLSLGIIEYSVITHPFATLCTSLLLRETRIETALIDRETDKQLALITMLLVIRLSHAFMKSARKQEICSAFSIETETFLPERGLQ